MRSRYNSWSWCNRFLKELYMTYQTYQERFYRTTVKSSNLKSFRACVRETDLFILADTDLSELAIKSIIKYRSLIESYINLKPIFFDSLIPIESDNFAHNILKDMIKASTLANVGPMASVAGAIAEFVAKDLLLSSKNIIVENGGDIFIKTNFDVKVGVFAGNSPLSNKLKIKISKEDMPLAVCTSSGTVGHSLSFGNADAVCVLSRSASLADATATAMCNIVKDKSDIKKALDFGCNIEGVLGALIIIDNYLGLRGRIEIV